RVIGSHLATEIAVERCAELGARELDDVEAGIGERDADDFEGFLAIGLRHRQRRSRLAGAEHRDRVAVTLDDPALALLIVFGVDPLRFREAPQPGDDPGLVAGPDAREPGGNRRIVGARALALLRTCGRSD